MAERSVATLAISIGLVNFTGKLYKPGETNTDEKLKTVCPQCVTPMTQEYKCANGHPSLLPAETGKAKQMEDGTLVLLTQEQIEKAKESKLAKGEMEIRIHPLEEVEHLLVPSNLTYVFTPTGNPATYGLLLDLIVAHPELVFVGMLNLRSDKLMRLLPGMNGQLLVQEVEWPNDVKEFPTPQYEYPEKLRAQGDTLVMSLVEPFDADAYTKASREAMIAAVEEANGGAAVPAKVPVKKAEDLADVLAASLVAAKAKKPAKKAPAKKTPVKKAS